MPHGNIPFTVLRMEYFFECLEKFANTYAVFASSTEAEALCTSGFFTELY
jgi:hypothetical protein